MRTEPTAAVLLKRFGQELNKTLYPFFIVSVIERNGSATRHEVREEIFRLTHGAFPCEPLAHDRQMSRMEKTFGLIEQVEISKNSTLARYRLTGKGKRLYEWSFAQLIEPLQEFLKG